MIPIPVKLENLNNIIAQKMFMANEIVPLAIQKDPFDETKRQYKILFKLTESITQSNVFFECRVIVEDDIDKSYLQSKSIYIENIKKDENKFSAFKEIMKDFSNDVFYLGDLMFNFSVADGNYYVDGIKALLDQEHNLLYYEAMRIFINKQTFITLSLYIQDILDPYNGSDKEYLFLSKNMSNMRFEKGEEIKLIATCKKDGATNSLYSYNTMYEINCGPTSWKFTYEIITEEDLEPKEPLGASVFDPEYSQYNDRFIGVVVDCRGVTFVVLKNDKDRVVAIVLPTQLVNKTNLLDPYNIFVNKMDEEESEQEDELSIENMMIQNRTSGKEELENEIKENNNEES